jgi:hypothetical protein
VYSIEQDTSHVCRRTSLTHTHTLTPSLPTHSSSAEPTEEQPPDTATPQQQQQQQQQMVIQPQADLLGGNLLDLLDISTGPPASSGPAYNAPAGGGGGRENVVHTHAL